MARNWAVVDLPPLWLTCSQWGLQLIIGVVAIVTRLMRCGRGRSVRSTTRSNGDAFAPAHELHRKRLLKRQSVLRSVSVS